MKIFEDIVDKMERSEIESDEQSSRLVSSPDNYSDDRLDPFEESSEFDWLLNIRCVRDYAHYYEVCDDFRNDIYELLERTPYITDYSKIIISGRIKANKEEDMQDVCIDSQLNIVLLTFAINCEFTSLFSITSFVSLIGLFAKKGTKDYRQNSLSFKRGDMVGWEIMPFANMDSTNVHTMIYKSKYTNGREFRYITAVAAALGYGHMTIDWYRQIKDTYHGNFVEDLIIFPNTDKDNQFVGISKRRTRSFVPFARRAMISIDKLKALVNKNYAKAWWDVIYMDGINGTDEIELSKAPIWLDIIKRVQINRSYFLFKNYDGETLYMKIYVGDTFANDSPLELVLNISADFNSEDRRNSAFINIFKNMFDEEDVPRDVIDYIVEDINLP